MQCLAKAIFKTLGWILLIPVYIYKYAISPFTPASCRHVPTCSEYAVQAIKIHGPFKGFWLATAVFRNVIHGEHTVMTRFLKKKQKTLLKHCAKSNNYIEPQIEKPILDFDVYIANN